MANIFDGWGGGTDAGELDDADGRTRSYYDDGESHVYRPDDHRTASADDGYRGGGGPIGSGDLDIGLDEDTGRVSQEIGGAGSGGVDAVGSGDYTSVGSIPASLVGTDVLRDVEQRLEEFTSGRAFGDPAVEDTIGSGTAVVEVARDEARGVLETLDDWEHELRLTSVALGIVGSLLTVWAFTRED